MQLKWLPCTTALLPRLMDKILPYRSELPMSTCSPTFLKDITLSRGKNKIQVQFLTQNHHEIHLHNKKENDFQFLLVFTVNCSDNL